MTEYCAGGDERRKEGRKEGRKEREMLGREVRGLDYLFRPSRGDEGKEE